MRQLTLYISIFFSTLVSFSQNPAPVVRYCGFNVNTGDVEISWDSSTAAAASYYQVWYYYPPTDGLSGGWIQVSENIPVTANRFSSFDPNGLLRANPLEQPVVIGIQTFDAGDISLNSLNENDFDSTIYLTAQYDSCLAQLDLQWTNYSFKRMPEPGNSGYNVYISNDDGANYTVYATVPYGTNSFQINDLDENQNYLLYIAAVSRNYPDEEANSTLVHINTNMAVLPRFMHANYATYNSGNAEVSFSIDLSSETNKYNLLRSPSPNGQFDSIIRFNTNEKEILYTDIVPYANGPYYYRLEVINNCNVKIRESDNLASTLLLKRQGEKLTPNFSWNPYLNWTDGVSNYTLERKFSNTEFEVVSNTSDTAITDTELASLVENNYISEVCYQVKAYENSGVNQSLSNPVCYELPPNIRFEFDAFMPGSGTNNDTFGPTIDFLPTEYTFEILDRKGMVVYRTSDPENTRWDGYIDGKLAEQGAYLCVIQYRMGDNKRNTVHGAVSVVY